MKNNDNLDFELDNLKEKILPLSESLISPEQLDFNKLDNTADNDTQPIKTKTPKRVIYRRVAAAVCVLIFVVGISLSMPGISSIFFSVKPTNSISAVYSSPSEATELIPVAKSYDEIYDLLYEKYDSWGYYDINNDTDIGLFATDEAENSIAYESREYGYTTGTLRKEVSGFGFTNSALGDYSGTNVQVNGVDESDIVKSDGKYIYTVNGSGVHIIETTLDGQTKLVASILNNEDNDSASNEDEVYSLAEDIYLANNKLVIIFNSSTSFASKVLPNNMYSSYLIDDDYYSISSSTRVDIYDITDPANPVFERTFSQDGSIVSTRMIGNTLYIVSNYYVSPQSIEDYKTMVPNVRDSCYEEGETLPLDYACINLLPDFEDTSYLVTTSLDITGTIPAETNALLGAGSTVYSSTDNLYVVRQKLDELKINSDEYEKFITYLPDDMADEYEKFKTYLPDDMAYEYFSMTEIIKYSLAGGKITLSAMGEVPGYTYDQYAMDEHNGYFRIAVNNRYTNKDNEYINMASLFILDENLSIVGSLVDMAHDEEIKSVRFMGEKIYIVTFKQVDPLFVIDASDPYNPTVLGELKIPGFSEYLHPYSEDILIGVGYNTKTDYYEYYDDISKKTIREEFETTDGIKLSLFDVSDPLNPIEIDTYSLDGETESSVMHDPKAFLFSKRNNLIGFPVESYSDDYSSHYYILHVDESGFSYIGKISNNTANNSNYAWDYSAERGLYIGDVLYTVSLRNIVASDMHSLDFVSETELPYYEYINEYKHDHNTWQKKLSGVDDSINVLYSSDVGTAK